MRFATISRTAILSTLLVLGACAGGGYPGGQVACSGGANTLAGVGAGALGGGLLGNMAGNRDGRNTRTLGGAAAGGLVGGLLGAMTERPCAPAGGYGYGGPVAVHPAQPPIYQNQSYGQQGYYEPRQQGGGYYDPRQQGYGQQGGYTGKSARW